MELQDVVPWGRSLKEYRKMFSLSEQDLYQSHYLGLVYYPIESALLHQFDMVTK